MTNRGSWYHTVQGSRLEKDVPLLEQGDILIACPRFRIDGLNNYPEVDMDMVGVTSYEVNAVILTQTCDLANSKVDEVLLAEVIDWDTACRSMVAAGNGVAKSTDYREALIKGNVPGLSLLDKHRADDLQFPYSVVNFHLLFTLPKRLVEQFASSCGLRLRMSSPYKESLAQAFARYFMRVGLPHDAKEFKLEGKVDF